MRARRARVCERRNILIPAAAAAVAAILLPHHTHAYTRIPEHTSTAAAIYKEVFPEHGKTPLELHFASLRPYPRNVYVRICVYTVTTATRGAVPTADVVECGEYRAVAVRDDVFSNVLSYHTSFSFCPGKPSPGSYGS